MLGQCSSFSDAARTFRTYACTHGPLVDLQNAEGVKKQIYFDNPTVDNNNAILDELDTFAEAINNQTTPIVTLHDGTEALRVATQIINSF